MKWSRAFVYILTWTTNNWTVLTQTVSTLVARVNAVLASCLTYLSFINMAKQHTQKFFTNRLMSFHWMFLKTRSSKTKMDPWAALLNTESTKLEDAKQSGILQHSTLPPLNYNLQAKVTFRLGRCEAVDTRIKNFRRKSTVFWLTTHILGVTCMCKDVHVRFDMVAV